MTLGELIKIKRTGKGLTQMALAQKLNMTMQAVSKWERDLSQPSAKHFPLLAECLGINVQMLVNANALPQIETRSFEAEFIQQAILQVYGTLVPVEDILPVLCVLNNIVPLNSRYDEIEAKRSEYLASFQKQEQTDIAQKIFEIIVSRSATIALPALKYSILKRTGITKYPLENLKSVSVDMRDFACYNVPYEAFADRQTCPVALFQDSPFNLERFGISRQRSYIIINRNSPLLEDGGVYLYSCSNGTFLAGFSNTLTGNYTIANDLAQSVVSKEEHENINFQLLGKALSL